MMLMLLLATTDPRRIFRYSFPAYLIGLVPWPPCWWWEEDRGSPVGS